jgi:hypothetical protein
LARWKNCSLFCWVIMGASLEKKRMRGLKSFHKETQISSCYLGKCSTCGMETTDFKLSSCILRKCIHLMQIGTFAWKFLCFYNKSSLVELFTSMTKLNE